MESVGSFEAKTHLPQLLERVAHGEEFTITKHGKPVARLVPTLSNPPKPDLQAAVAAMKAFRQGRSLGGLSIRAMIDEGRRFSLCGDVGVDATDAIVLNTIGVNSIWLRDVKFKNKCTSEI